MQGTALVNRNPKERTCKTLELFYLIQERALPFSVLALLMMASAIVVYVVWKKQVSLPLSLRIFTTVVCLTCIIGSAGLMLFTLFVGYNA